MKEFSKSWISSKKPNKQRKYRFNAPLHMRGEFLNVHLSKELRLKYNMRALRVRVGDKVRIMRGQFKKQEGKVEEVNMKYLKVYISKIEHVKRDGSKARYPLQPSNLLLVELDTEDKKRFKDRKTAQVADVAKPQTAKPVVAKPVKSEVKTSDVKPQVAQKTPTKK
jgi:large subunit ribosomal protein L24